MKKEIYYATGNVGKFDEVKRFLEKNNPEIELKQLTDELIEIQTMDQKAIAISKAEQAWDTIKKPVIVDDSGIYFAAYNNFPGTLTKFIYHGIGYEGIFKLVEDNNQALRRIYLVFKDSDNGHQVFEGTCQGKIVRPKVLPLNSLLPYNAIFQPDGSNKTSEQLHGTPEEPKFAYRLKALKKFLNFIS